MITRNYVVSVSRVFTFPIDAKDRLCCFIVELPGHSIELLQDAAGYIGLKCTSFTK